MPEGWELCRLGQIYYHTTGKALKKSNEKGSLKKYITTSNLYWDTFDFTEVRSMYFTDEELEKCTIKKGDLVLCNGGDVGRAAIWNYDEEICYQNHVSRMRPKANGINNRFYLYILMLYKEQDMLNGKGVGISSLSASDLLSAIVPLPPEKQQTQIVAKIEEIFVQIDALETDKSDLQTAIRQTKSKILDLAIHGKLVPQDSSDEPASVLLERLREEKEAKIKAGELKRDKNDSFIYKSTTDNCYYEKFQNGTEELIEVPYDLPESWSWVKIKDVISYIGDGDWIESKDQSDNGIRLIQTGNIGFGNFKDKKGKYHYITEETFDKLCCNEIFPGDILISRLPEPVGRSCIIPNLSQRLITAVDCTIIRLNEKIIIREYFVYYTQSSKYLGFIKDNCTGTTRLRISRANLEKIYIPLPSLPEQHRILNKVESIFKKLDEITLNLI